MSRAVAVIMSIITNLYAMCGFQISNLSFRLFSFRISPGCNQVDYNPQQKEIYGE